MGSSTLVLVRVLISLLLVALVLLSIPLCAQTKPGAGPGFAALAAKANAARDADRLNEAAALYRKALALRPKWAEGWWSLGTIAYDRSSYPEAVRAFQKVTNLSPKHGTAYVMLGLSEFELKHDAPALQHIEKGIGLGLDKDPDLQRVALYHVGVLKQRRGEFQAAQEMLEQLCLQGAQSDNVANALGLTLLRLTSTTPPAPGSADGDIVLPVGRAECLAGQKKYDEARRIFDEVVTQHPDYPNLHYAYGLFLLEARDLSAGVEQLKQEIANNPAHLFARLQIAAAQYKTDSQAGIPYVEEALKLNPAIPFGHFLLGLLLLDTNQPARAIPELEIARQTFSRDPKVYFALGSAYSRVGRKSQAARARAMFERLNAAAGNAQSNEGEAGSFRPLPR